MDHLQCSTCGVPVRIAVPPLLSAMERALFEPIYQVSVDLSIEAADLIALLVRKHATLSVYTTDGGIVFNTDGQEVLVDQRKNWTIQPAYRKILEKIALRFHVPFRTVQAVEQTFRVKRARGDIAHTDDSGRTRYIVWYQPLCTVPAHGLVGCWFDIAPSDDIASANMWQSREDATARKKVVANIHQDLQGLRPRVPRSCATCHQKDLKAVRNQICKGCLLVSYCSRACQKVDWKSHKKNCHK